MKIKQGMETAFADWKAKNSDAYSACVFAFAERWAEAIEERIAAGERLVDVARDLASAVDNLPEMRGGITGFQYGAAVSVLAQCWEHGESLRRWHNGDVQLRDEGDKANETPGAVLNPALLRIGGEP